MEKRVAELRIDRWLWFARFYKTRSVAAKAVTGGHVKLNGERARSASRVREGDRLEIVKERLVWKLRVTAIPVRRGPAVEARRCYEEDEEARAAREQHLANLRQDRLAMPRTDGRPDKHTRRKLRARNRDY